MLNTAAVGPAQHGFGADDATRVAVDDRLKCDIEFILVRRDPGRSDRPAGDGTPLRMEELQIRAGAVAMR